MSSQENYLSKEEQLKEKVLLHLESIYSGIDKRFADQLIEAIRVKHKDVSEDKNQRYWDQKTILCVTYGDSITRESEYPLKTLSTFLENYVSDIVTDIHILPFFPFSSDDGFSVKNYYEVNKALGTWSNLEKIASNFRLMSDLVINHCSSHHDWFLQFKKCESPGKDYFLVVNPKEDLSAVVRPRTSELLRPTKSSQGVKNVWCTFSHDQVDLNFGNPEVLLEIVRIIKYYLDRGVRILRLDAVAFLWKVPGTSCLNLPTTHEIVRLLRTLIDSQDVNALIVTETNIPNRENLSYFGNANEAHIIYNFALPPLILQAMISGNNYHLNNWLMSMPPARDGTAYLNFLASHDGIGLRPVEGILSETEMDELIETMEQFGGQVSYRSIGSAEKQPYEINISLFSALKGTASGSDSFNVDRFLCAHTIMIALEGIPAIYVHSFLASENDLTKLKETGIKRAINRGQWCLEELDLRLSEKTSVTYRVFQRIKSLLKIRIRQPAFHPNATQYTLHLGEGLFSFWRQSRSREQSIFCIHNITNGKKSFTLNQLNLIEGESWRDLFEGTEFTDFKERVTLEPYQCIWVTNYDK